MFKRRYPKCGMPYVFGWNNVRFGFAPIRYHLLAGFPRWSWFCSFCVRPVVGGVSYQFHFFGLAVGFRKKGGNNEVG